MKDLPETPLLRLLLSYLSHRPFFCDLLELRRGVVEEIRGVHGVLLLFRKLNLLFRRERHRTNYRGRSARIRKIGQERRVSF